MSHRVQDFLIDLFNKPQNRIDSNDQLEDLMKTAKLTDLEKHVVRSKDANVLRGFFNAAADQIVCRDPDCPERIRTTTTRPGKKTAGKKVQKKTTGGTGRKKPRGGR